MASIDILLLCFIATQNFTRRYNDARPGKMQITKEKNAAQREDCETPTARSVLSVQTSGTARRP
jgi:hypothetical protein